MSDLLSELRRASMRVRQVHLDQMRALGVSIEWLADLEPHPFGVGQCEAMGAGLYQPNPDAGRLHVILPVVEDEVLVDLVALRSTHPQNWLLRTGNSWALGLERGLGEWLWYAPADPAAKPPRHQVGSPVHLFSDPLDWLRGRGEGLCVLDWSSPEVRTLDVLPEVVCSTNAVAKLLVSALTRPARVPQIRVMEMRNVA